jgi:hypothetical protein
MIVTTQQLLVSTDDVNTMGEITDITKDTKPALDASKVVGKQVENMFMFPHQNAGHKHDTKKPNEASENVEQFTYCGTIFNR